MATLFFDLEANGWRDTATTIWVISYAIDDEEVQSIKEVENFWSVFRMCTCFVGHNILNFDIPLLARLGCRLDLALDIRDTIVLSRLIYPDLQSPPGWVGKSQPHSLEAWAMRMGGEQKVQHEDWSQYSEEMRERCESDVRITRKLYRKLMKEIQ